MAGVPTQHRVESPSLHEQLIVEEIPQVVGSLLPSEEFDVPVYNHIHQEQIVQVRRPRTYLKNQLCKKR